MALAKYAEEIQELIWERKAIKEREMFHFVIAPTDSKATHSQFTTTGGATTDRVLPQTDSI